VIHSKKLKQQHMKYAALSGRILFSLIFLVGGLGHFSPQSIGYAASQGVPMASVLVPFSGILSITGALSILLGYRAKIGAWLIIIFLVPVTLSLHRFWTIQDPMMKQMDMAMFMKNLGLLGGALFIAFFGAGPVSIDDKAKLQAPAFA
jgi:putative oxidoreductase